MPNTTNFNWATPADTDLVKDGAAAIRTLGSSIDTSFVDLKGGTTGQVLSKASNTDLDYSWVTTDDANAIQNAIVDAKGDLIAASANDTPARLAVGNSGETLVADSSTSTGLRYSPANAVGNPTLNSAMQVWQRGTSFTVASSTFTYTADRWLAYRTATGLTVSRQTTGDTTNLPNIQYCTRISRDSGNTSTAVIDFAQTFESVNSIPYAGKTITFSFYARKGANYSPTTSYVVFKTGTGTDQNVLSGLTGAVNAVLVNQTFTTTWTRYTYTATLDANITQLGFYLDLTPVGTAGAADYLEVTGFQIDLGSVALPFRTYAGTIQGELAACQRYYYRTSNNGAYTIISFGGASSTTSADMVIGLPATMRINPSSVDFSTIALQPIGGGSITAITSVSVLSGTQSNAAVATGVASGLSSGAVYRLLTNNSTSGYIGFSAEL